MPPTESTSVKSLEKRKPLKVAWYTYFPVEWIEEAPSELRDGPRLHPATWQRVLWEEFRGNPGLSLDILVVRGSFSRSFTFERHGTRFHCIKTPGKLRSPTFYWLDTFMVSRKLRQIRPDLSHAWGTEFGAASVAGRIRQPALVTMQGIMTWCRETFPLNWHQRMAARLEPAALRKARVASCESKFAMRYLGERYPNLNLLQIEHAPNPIFAKIKRKPVPGKIVAVGHFSHGKGADTLIEALGTPGLAANVELAWVGSRDAALEQELKSRTPSDLWRRVHFKPNLTPSQVAEELATAHLLVHATRADNSPNAVKEAVVAGVPVIASNLGGIPDYVIPGQNGFLFSAGDVSGLAACINKALAEGQFAGGLVNSSTLARMRDYLSAPTMAAKFLEAYDTTLRVWNRPSQGQV